MLLASRVRRAPHMEARPPHLSHFLFIRDNSNPLTTPPTSSPTMPFVTFADPKYTTPSPKKKSSASLQGSGPKGSNPRALFSEPKSATKKEKSPSLTRWMIFAISFTPRSPLKTRPGFCLPRPGASSTFLPCPRMVVGTSTSLRSSLACSLL